MVKVELVYLAKDGSSFYLEMSLPAGTTVGAALNQSRIYDTHPEVNTLAVGIYSKIVSQDTILKDGDRIEIYRSLLIDPKEKRRQIAKVKKTQKK
ncbi:RnfH family protein [Legionella sp. km772]|uniref:RnfH family protein n=1 Tax=Legionella sp. km772 TaxID=2498111 RepID=UPI000F8D67C4|nr:RnfH family protein [Legionella sp. km772]RUR12276.1 RnfH family protein [Legionella sp. km772]